MKPEPDRAVPPSSGEAQFKNFHRLLCERFDYFHDEQDWKRDQLSLIEWIARRSAHPAPPSVAGESADFEVWLAGYEELNGLVDQPTPLLAAWQAARSAPGADALLREAREALLFAQNEGWNGRSALAKLVAKIDAALGSATQPEKQTDSGRDRDGAESNVGRGHRSGSAKP